MSHTVNKRICHGPKSIISTEREYWGYVLKRNECSVVRMAGRWLRKAFFLHWKEQNNLQFTFRWNWTNSAQPATSGLIWNYLNISLFSPNKKGGKREIKRKKERKSEKREFSGIHHALKWKKCKALSSEEKEAQLNCISIWISCPAPTDWLHDNNIETLQ